MDFTVIVTVGPATLVDSHLREIHRHGSCIYRVNGSHCLHPQDVMKTVREIPRRFTRRSDFTRFAWQ